MLYKYKVPEHYLEKYKTEVIYCEVVRSLENLKPKIYLVKMLNVHNLSNIFNEKDLKKLNIIDKIKVIYIKRRNNK